MSNFPLYDILLKKIDEKDANKKLTQKEIRDIVKSFTKTFTKNDFELVYVLIRVYELQTSGQCEKLPYGLKIINGELSADIMDFPILLQRIIQKFIEMNNQKLEEEHLKFSSFMKKTPEENKKKKKSEKDQDDE